MSKRKDNDFELPKSKPKKKRESGPRLKKETLGKEKSPTKKARAKNPASKTKSTSKKSRLGEEKMKKDTGKKRNFKKLPVPSKDVDTILKEVVELGKKEKEKNAKEPRKKLKDLDVKEATREVAEMDEDFVRAEIEKLFIQITHSILEGKGFQYLVPARTANYQLYIPELDRIVLKDKLVPRIFSTIKNTRKSAITTRILQLIYELCIKKIHVTKRDLFYTDVKLFTTQKDSDDILDDAACMVGCTRSSLNVVAAEKGIVVGRVQFREDGDFIDCTKMGSGGKAIPPYTDRITDIKGDAKFILLVEKDAAFMRLAEDRFYNQYPCIIMTGKGQPDVATRLLLRRLKDELKIPVLGLVDSDPYGLKILSVYMSGSKNMSYDSASLTTPDIKWLGVRPSDLDKYNIPEQCRLEMTDSDIQTGKNLLNEGFIKKNPDWCKELELMVKNKEKAEIQALSNFGFQYLTQVYLPLKLQQGDWI